MSKSKTKALNDPSIPRVTSLSDSALVTFVDPTSGAVSTIDYASLKALIKDSIQIGGRNLLKYSNEAKSSSDYTIATYNWGNEAPAAGDTICVTVWGELGENRTEFAALSHRGMEEDGCIKLKQIAPGVYQGSGSILGKWEYARIYAMPSYVKTPCTINRIKIERGNIATDWSPAPEDLGWKNGGGKYLTLNYIAERRAAA